MTTCCYCKGEIPASAFEVCVSCGDKVWGRKMYLAIKQNMEDAQSRDDLTLNHKVEQFLFIKDSFLNGFFLGYSLHLLADSFTKAGITPFWPYSRIAKGHLITGGVVEKGIFFMFVFLDILTAMVYLF